MQISTQEITDLKNFVTLLNLETNSIVVVEGKKDSFALKTIGFSGKVFEFHKFGGLIKFTDFAASYKKVIVLFDGDRKGRYLTAKLIEQLQRRTKVDLSFKRKLVCLTKGKIRCIEQLICYESAIN